MVERGNHNPDVVGSNPTIIIYLNINTEGSIVWFNAPVLGTGDQRFESFSSEFINFFLIFSIKILNMIKNYIISKYFVKDYLIS